MNDIFHRTRVKRDVQYCFGKLWKRGPLHLAQLEDVPEDRNAFRAR